VKPITQRTVDVFAAAGRTLAADAMAPSRPASSLALLDGWAISADETLGAGGHAPSPLLRVPSRIEAGQALPVSRHLMQ
jgi:molybdopterin biosynthesis enzyme